MTMMFQKLLILLAVTALTTTTTTDAFTIPFAKVIRLTPLFSSVESSPTPLFMETEWSHIEDIRVQTLQNETMALGDIIQCGSSSDGDAPIIISCLSHFGDFNAWELTQQYMAAIDSGRMANDRYDRYIMRGVVVVVVSERS
jgi:hypothetical protein